MEKELYLLQMAVLNDRPPWNRLTRQLSAFNNTSHFTILKNNYNWEKITTVSSGSSSSDSSCTVQNSVYKIKDRQNGHIISIVKSFVCTYPKKDNIRKYHKMMVNEYQNELITNLLLPSRMKNAVVPMIACAILEDQLYMEFEYQVLGNIHDYLYSFKKGKFMINPYTVIDILKKCLKVLDDFHSTEFQGNHFDCRCDNMYIHVESLWEDCEDFPDDVETVDYHEADNEYSFTVLLADFGHAEITLHGERLENSILPRDPSYKRQWGLFPRVFTPSYDFWYFLICTNDILNSISLGYCMEPLWNLLKKRFPTFDKVTFFNREGRMTEQLPLTYPLLMDMIGEIETHNSTFVELWKNEPAILPVKTVKVMQQRRDYPWYGHIRKTYNYARKI